MKTEPTPLEDYLLVLVSAIAAFLMITGVI